MSTLNYTKYLFTNKFQSRPQNAATVFYALFSTVLAYGVIIVVSVKMWVYLRVAFQLSNSAKRHAIEKQVMLSQIIQVAVPDFISLSLYNFLI